MPLAVPYEGMQERANGTTVVRPGDCHDVRNAPLRAEPSSIVYAYPDQSVWTTATDAQGRPANPLLRGAEALFARAGLEWRAEAYPAARMFERLKNGAANFSMLVRSSQLDQCCLIGAKPVASTELRVYRRDGTPAITGRDGLRGARVIAIRGYSYGGLLPWLSDPANGVDLEAVTSHDSAFTMLERGRADYVLDYAGPAGEILSTRKHLAARHETLDRLDVYLVLSRSFPQAEATMARLEAIAEELDLDVLAGLNGLARR